MCQYHKRNLSAYEHPALWDPVCLLSTCRDSVSSQTAHPGASGARGPATPDVATTKVEGMGEVPPAARKFPGVRSDEEGEEGVGQKREDGRAPQVRRFLGEMRPG